VLEKLQVTLNVAAKVSAVYERPQSQAASPAAGGGSTKYFIPPPPIVAQLGRLPAMQARARPTSHLQIRVIVRMTLLLYGS
jgi:hypothetical protein